MPSANLFTIHYHLFPNLVGLTGIEPVTSSLSGTRSNQLSYKPGFARKGRGTLRRETLVRFNIGLSRRPGLPGRERPSP